MISRILAIVVTVLSIAFLGFARVTTFGGPNWRGMARSMKGYQFTRSEGDPPTWSVSSPNGENLGSFPVLPGAIVAALDHQSENLQAELRQLNDTEPEVSQKLESIDRQIAADREALQASVARKRQRLDQLQQEYSQLSRQVVEQTEQGQAVEDVIADRRSDVFRLTNQLEVLRADEARIEKIHRQMSDLIEQIDADLEIARRREQQLGDRLGIGP